MKVGLSFLAVWSSLFGVLKRPKLVVVKMHGTLLSEILQKYGREAKIKDPEKVENLLSSVISKGFDSLQVITDFDHTLTRFHKDGVVCSTCHGIIHNSSFMAEDYRQRSEALYNKYHPIEIDHTLTDEEKLPHMLQWYDESHENMMSSPFEKHTIKEMVDSSNIEFRDHTVEMLDTLHQKNVPVMVFSAGIGDILEVVLENNNVYHSNTIVVSNFMDFNEKGLLRGFKEPLIHMYNKNEKSVLQLKPTYFDELTHRPNVLLLGDAQGDKNMSEGVSKGGAVLKIGFLNTKIEPRLEVFMNTFDIVLVDDQSMDFVNAILSRMSTPEGTDNATS